MAMNRYRDVPTVVLEGMWERERVRLSGMVGLRTRDFDDLLAMRSELDRRRDEEKDVVDVNFSKDYLTD